MTFLLIAAASLLAASPGTSRAASSTSSIGLAERIYREGVLPSGKPLQGVRAGVEVAGSDAACVQCHRRSGMGMAEGGRIVPPITGQFLYRPRATTLAQMDSAHSRGPDLAHALGRDRPRPPYSDASLLTALREGVGPGGQPLEELMPRYRLDGADARLLLDYLKQLSYHWSPGVSRESIQLATVIAPGVDPLRRKALLDVLRAFVGVHNSSAKLEKLRDRNYSGASVNTYRSWQLHVWELAGPPEGWEAQLAALYRRQPVFALLSGLSEGGWGPVQHFSERLGIPCWFPIVDLPEQDTGFYTAYFNGGVALEAAVLAHQLREAQPARVVQVSGPDLAERGAAEALRRALEGSPLRLEDRTLQRVDGPLLAHALSDLRSGEVVVLWLRSRELAALSELSPPPVPAYFSTTLTSGENAPFPGQWKRGARLVYPFELPDKRRANLARFHAWLQTRNLPLVDERTQADAYLASMLLSQKLDEMLESLYRDYLVERAEAFLGERVTTGTYHSLGLGPGQRFASKGAFIARFASPEGRTLVAESNWIVP